MSSGSAPPQRLSAAARAMTPSRARPRLLDRATVLATALSIVDEEGLAALTMRRLAGDLGVGLATIYAAAGGKEEILQGLADNLLEALPAEDDGRREWDAALVDLYRSVHRILVEHPAVAHLAAVAPVVGPGVFELQERTLRLLRAGGLDERSAVGAYTSIRSYVVGFALLESSRTGAHAAEERGRQAAIGRLPPEQFPHLTALAPYLADALSTDQFVEGLAQLIRGFAPGGPPRRRTPGRVGLRPAGRESK